MTVREFIKQIKYFDSVDDIEMTDAISGKTFIGTPLRFRIFLSQFPEWLNAEVIGSGNIGRTLQLDVALAEK